MNAALEAQASIEALRSVLNAANLTSAVERAGLGSGASVDIARVHFSDKRPTVLHLRLNRGSRSEILLAEFVGEDAARHAQMESTRLSKSRRAQICKQQQSPLAADQQSGLVFRPLGLDARLPGLRLISDRAAASELMASAMGRVDGPIQVTLVAHRLGKRAVLRLEDKTGRCCFVRLGPTASDGAARLYDRHAGIAKSLEDHPDIAVPRPMLFDQQLGAAVYTALSGSPLPFYGAAGFRGMYAAMKALDALHSRNQDSLPAYGPSRELEIVSAWHDRVSALRPEYQKSLNVAHTRVSSELQSMPSSEPSFCHRDFHEGQILIGRDNRAGILDFDTAVCADPMIDVGNLMAHIFLHGLTTGLMVAPFEQAAGMGARFDRPRNDRKRVRIWRRAALLRLACIYAVTSKPRSVVEALLFEAQA